MRKGEIFHGISVLGCGVFTSEYGALTYAGQHKDGYACGLGVTITSDHTSSYGKNKEYAEYGPDGKYDGRCVDPYSGYSLYERGKPKAHADVFADGRCKYNGEACAPDDPRVLALIAQVAPVEVRPAARAPQPPLARPLAPKQSSDGSAGSFCPRRRWRPPWPPRCSPHSARCRWWLRDTAQQ